MSEQQIKNHELSEDEIKQMNEENKTLNVQINNGNDPSKALNFLMMGSTTKNRDNSDQPIQKDPII